MINVHSEIGKLNTVLVHRPGDEFKFIHPSMLAEQLFEDTPYLPSAQREHDSFTGILRNAGVEVLEQSELFTNVMRDDYLRSHFTDEYIAASDIQSVGLAQSLREYYDSLTVEQFVKKSSIIQYSPAALADDADSIMAIARHEGLWAHARSVELRMEK